MTMEPHVASIHYLINTQSYAIKVPVVIIFLNLAFDGVHTASFLIPSNNLQDKTDTYCSNPKLCLVMEHDSTILERDTMRAISLRE